MQLKPFSNPFARKMLEKTPATAQLVFIDEESDLVEEPEDLIETQPVDIPNIGPFDKRKTDTFSDDDLDGGVLVEVPKSTSPRVMAMGKPENKVTTVEITAMTEGVKRVKLDIPAKAPATTETNMSTTKRMPPRIRRSSTTIFSHSTIDAPMAPPRPRSARLFSLPTVVDEPPAMPSLRRVSTSRPGPAPPPKPQFRPLQRRATTPAEAQLSRQLSRSSSCITLPSLDIVQNASQMYRESELLIDLLNKLKNHWPDRPYAVMNHLRTSLLISLAVYDDSPARPAFASDHGGSSAIKKTVCRFKRYRGDKESIDLSLVVWSATFMTFREQSLLQETQRYRPQYSGRSNQWPGAQRVIWYPSWEPTRNLEEGMAEQLSAEKEKLWKKGGELTFEIPVSDGDWC
ncbi:hypothetical protein H072_10003 [Dactylellina haptotyla CBS 200.50]|uniref:Uncharacterized protein n=1 Tax=Dactylellina haptotyla (strain CBS 200.50) TaxID=1284197 RepID=S8A1B0_DACHA|nr:hypothetical protein H072_10003 [Dactylellina haptotyla CBS 200.50]